MRRMLRRFYLEWVLGRPVLFVLLFLAMGGWFATYVPDFKVSAGTSSLILEGDDTKVIYDETRRHFTSDDYVLVAVQPQDPWSPEGIDLVERLTEEIRGLDGIESVLSPINAPLPRAEFRSKVIGSKVFETTDVFGQVTRRQVGAQQQYGHTHLRSWDSPSSARHEDIVDIARRCFDAIEITSDSEASPRAHWPHRCARFAAIRACTARFV